MHGGFQSGVRIDGVVESLGATASCWHHYAQSWNLTSGEIRVYIDGKFLLNKAGVGPGSTFLDKRATIMLGGRCVTTDDRHYIASRRSYCDMFKTRLANFHGSWMTSPSLRAC